MSIELVMLLKHLAPSPLVFTLSQCQSLFQWVVSSHQVAKVLELQLQHQSFQCIFSVDFLEDWLVWSPCSFALVITFIKMPSYPHFLISLVSLLCCVLCFVSQSGLTLCGSMACSPSGSSVHGHSPGKNTGVGCHALLQGIFPTQGPNPGLPHCRQVLHYLSHQGSSLLWPFSHLVNSFLF